MLNAEIQSNRFHGKGCIKRREWEKTVWCVFCCVLRFCFASINLNKQWKKETLFTTKWLLLLCPLNSRLEWNDTHEAENRRLWIAQWMDPSRRWCWKTKSQRSFPDKTGHLTDPVEMEINCATPFFLFLLCVIYTQLNTKFSNCFLWQQWLFYSHLTIRMKTFMSTHSE